MIEFVVRVPDATPDGQSVFLAGDGPHLGDWSADGVRLERWDDGTRRVSLDLPDGFHGRCLATLGRWRTAEANGHGRERWPHELHISGSATRSLEVQEWGRNCIDYHQGFPSRFLPQARTITVWLPPTYDLEPQRRYPVLYLHDGQNLFDPETAFAGNPWWANEVAERVIRRGLVEPLLLVGVANTVDRIREYGPRRGGQNQPDDFSRAYGRFLVEEVRPFIDSLYRTLAFPQHTGVGGSSMGGLISLYLCKWYPGVFGRCAALSPSLWWDREYFSRHLSVAPKWLDWCRIWLDMGSREGTTEIGMRAMLRRAQWLTHLLRRRCLREDDQFHFEQIEGGLHNEAAWGGRFDRMLQFLFPARG